MDYILLIVLVIIIALCLIYFRSRKSTIELSSRRIKFGDCEHLIMGTNKEHKILGGDESPLVKMIHNRIKKPNYLNQMLNIMLKQSIKYGNSIVSTKVDKKLESEDMSENLNHYLDKLGVAKTFSTPDAYRNPKKFFDRYLEYKKQPGYKPLIDIETIRQIRLD